MSKPSASTMLWTGCTLSVLAVSWLALIGAEPIVLITVAVLGGLWAGVACGHDANVAQDIKEREVVCDRLFADAAAGSESLIGMQLEALRAETQGAHGEIDQLRKLLADAIERLMKNFNALNEHVSNRRALESQMRSDSDGERAEQLERIAAGMATEIDDAMTALQFQDMADQLSGHVANRLALVEELMGNFERIPQFLRSMSPHRTPEEIGRWRALMDEVRVGIETARAERRASPVRQARATQGSMELF